jgi:hypothetical protein
MDAFTRLQSLVLAQGIVTRQALLPTTDLVQDLHYHPSDVAELIRMVESVGNVTIPEAEYNRLTRLEQFIPYLLPE